MRNYGEFRDQAADVPYELLKAVHCRSALRVMVVTKRFLDARNKQEDKFALAMFHDVLKAICETVFPNEILISDIRSHVAHHVNNELKLLSQNDDAFGYAYGCGVSAISDATVSTPQDRNSTIAHVKAIELWSHGSREQDLRQIFLPVTIDISTTKNTTTVRDVFSSRELCIGGGIGVNVAKQPADLVIALRDAGPNWSFWRDWYQGFLDGKPLDWELQRRVALIPDEDWEQGPEHIAEKIEKIRANFTREQALEAPKAKAPTKTEKESIAQKVQANRDALAINTASALAQIAEFRERVRKLNHLDKFGTELLQFLDDLSAQLEALLHDLPQNKEPIDDEKANRMVLWWRDYKSMSMTKLHKYVSAENAAEVTMPTGIILTCTGVGTLLGNPLVGSVVGGLIANQIKPSQAAKELASPNPPDVNGS